MKKLPKQEWRCSGRFCFKNNEICLERDTCLRYLSLIKFDRENGIENYQGIPVLMAEKNCQEKINIEEI
jgi:hypothetical protein